MTKIKSLVLGSAAAIVAIGGAQAADLPVKAKAVEYVKVCSLYGAGFYYIPGTDTCIRIGGYVRAEVNIGGASTDATYISGTAGNNDVYANYYTRSRIMMNIDTRTATEYGVVRTFGAFGPQFNSGNVDGPDTQAAGSMRVEAAFIQFAGFTFGRSASAYALPWNGAPGNLNSTLMGGPNYDAGVNNIQYTWQFGNGVSASIGVDAQEQANRVGVYNANGTINAVGAYNNAYQAGTAVDVVGNIRLDQAWGLIQLSAAAHQVTGNYYNGGATGNSGTIINGHPGDKWGFAVTGALQLKNLPTGPGDDIKISGTYTEGALRYVLGQSGATPRNFVRYDGGGLTFAGVPVADGVFDVGTGIELTKAYGFNGAFNHNWNKNWSSSVFGSWSHVDYNGNATTIICNAGYAANATTCNPDFNISQLGVSTTWKPVKNLAFIAEATWVNIKQNNVGVENGVGTRAGQGYAYGDQDAYSGVLRVQRNF
ncbi:porin [Afipia carboxidovorans OM5]|uniref:Porin n=1 Tax=Afipia carboxidovorans (strain ATCC 49405 / DSM 1227 / KCTC 32145 / OM5) TaxID=504832 RepID=B6JGA1_AFIC5|nr:porin [Afipia carboxidovorans]ACI92952.1 porin [Afipia carboxidovorans OM5]AEI03315.1 putative porin protein [Afipia carboxidovorans OM4]AEI06892.1 putative porin protein [Afipia carboxidovorans OM5]